MLGQISVMSAMSSDIVRVFAMCIGAHVLKVSPISLVGHLNYLSN